MFSWGGAGGGGKGGGCLVGGSEGGRAFSRQVYSWSCRFGHCKNISALFPSGLSPKKRVQVLSGNSHMTSWCNSDWDSLTPLEVSKTSKNALDMRGLREGWGASLIRSDVRRSYRLHLLLYDALGGFTAVPTEH